MEETETEKEKGRGFFGTVKVIGLIVLAVLLGIVFFQNTEMTTLKFLSWEINAPKAVLYPGLVAVGFLGGMVTYAIMRRAKRKKAIAKAKAK